jgi:hypothetical protein
MATAKKKSAKKAASKKRRKASRPRKKTPETRVQRVLSAIEQRIELPKIELDRSIMEERLLSAYRELLGRIQDRTASTRESAEAQLEELLERAQSSRAGEAFGELEGRVTDELDEVLEKLGLLRVVKHEELVAKAEKRAVSRERSRRRRADKAAAKKAEAKAAQKA